MHCVIEGFSCSSGADRRLYVLETPTSEPVVEVVPNISPYLIPGSNLCVSGRSTPISKEVPTVSYGSLPSDGGGLVVSPDEYPHGDSVAEKYLRPYVGSQELVNGEDRWVLWMPGGPEPGDVARSPFLKKRLEDVREFRRNSRNPDTQALADTPYRWFFVAQPSQPYVGIPAQVSENRRYYTVARMSVDAIASNTLYTAIDPDGFLVGLLSSSMFMTWISTIGGRLESRLRYAKSIVHNTFPVPIVAQGLRAEVIAAAQHVLDVRAAHPGNTLAELYDPLSMPPKLISAHSSLDKAVDSVFTSRKTLDTEADRLAVLFEWYERLESEG